MRAVDQIDCNENNCIRWKRNGRWSWFCYQWKPSWIVTCKMFLVLCEHELHKIDLRHNFIEFISWSEHLEVGGYIKWFRTRPIQSSSTWMHHFCNMKGILPLLGTQKVFKWTFHAFCFNLWGHNWNKCTVTTFHIPLGRNEH